MKCSRWDVKRGEGVKGVLDFNAVRADVLNGRCTHCTGDQTEIFQSAPTFFKGVQYGLVPIFATAKFHDHAIWVFLNDGATFNAIVQQQSREILREGDVAATAQNAKWLFLEGLFLKQSGEVFG